MGFYWLCTDALDSCQNCKSLSPMMMSNNIKVSTLCLYHVVATSSVFLTCLALHISSLYSLRAISPSLRHKRDQYFITRNENTRTVYFSYVQKQIIGSSCFSYLVQRDTSERISTSENGLNLYAFAIISIMQYGIIHT